MFPSVKELKEKGKETMRETLPTWVKLTVLFISLSLATVFLIRAVGGDHFIYDTLKLSEYPTAQTATKIVEDGVEFVYRVDRTDTVIVGFMSYVAMAMMLATQIVLFILFAPMKMALLQRYWQAYRKEKIEENSALKWYTTPALFGKAVLVELLINIVSSFAAIVGAMPSFLVGLTLAYTPLGEISTGTATGTLFLYLMLTLTLLGALFAFYVHAILQPIAYCLVAKPDYSIKQVVRRGFDSTKGSRKSFFNLRFTFIGWYIVSSFTYDILEMYILPYITFTSFHFLEAAAKKRQKDMQKEQPFE